MTGGVKPSFLKNPLMLVVVAVTVLIVAATIFMATRKETLPRSELMEAAAVVTPEQQVLGEIAQLMNAASSQPARAATAQSVYQQARDKMLAYVKQHPDDTRIHALLAEVYMRLGQNAQALATVDEVLRRKSDMAEALWIKGQLLRQAGDANFLDFFRQAADSPGATPKLQAGYGLALIQNRELDAAAEYLRKAVAGGANDAAT